MFLIVGVAGKNGTSVSTSNLDSRLTNPGEIAQCQAGVIIHARLIQALVEQANRGSRIPSTSHISFVQ